MAKKKKFFLSGIVNRNKINSFLMRDTKKKLIIGGAILLVIIIAVIIAVVLAGRVNYTKAKSGMLQKGMVSIGLRSDLNGFAKINEKTGKIEGYEADIAAEIVKRLFKNDKIDVEYQEINSKTGKVMLDQGELDFTLGAFVETNDEDYLAYSNPYYTDAIVFCARQGSISKPEDINGKTIGVVQSSFAGYNKKLEEFLKGKKVDCTYKYYSSYPDAEDALNAGLINIFAGSRILMQSYAKNTYEIPGYVLTHGYRIAIKKSKTDLIKAINAILGEMDRDKTLDGLKIKWQLKDYDNG